MSTTLAHGRAAGGLGLTKQQLAVTLCVMNPNPNELSFQRVTADLDVAGSPLAGRSQLSHLEPERFRRRIDPGKALSAGRRYESRDEHTAKIRRIWKNCFSPYLYRSRNAIRRMFGLKDFRRIAIRYDLFARNFYAAVICYWL